MTTTTNMGLVLPDNGASIDVWGLALNTLLGASGGGVDAHDHSTGKGVKVPSAGIGINADLSFAAFAMTAAKAVSFTAVATTAVSAYTSALFVNSADNNLYFRNSSGSNVQLTAGSTINVSLVGGIGGDYASVSALLSYVDATRTYLFQQEGSPRPWAGIETGDIKLYEKAASISNAVTLKSPSSLASAYTVTWPTALPASTMPLTMTSAGVLAGGASFAMQTNADITINGTGTYKHGTKTMSGPILSPTCYASAGTLSNVPPGGLLGATTTVYIPLPSLSGHQRILNVRLYYGSVADAGACTAKLFSTSNTAPIAGGFTDLSATMTPGSTSIATYSGINYTHSTGGGLWIQVTNSTGGERISSWAIDYDAP